MLDENSCLHSAGKPGRNAPLHGSDPDLAPIAEDERVEGCFGCTGTHNWRLRRLRHAGLFRLC